ncbi:amidohydrolase [Sphingobium sufflavum]|uniref:amidohydrolase n=1 Tax=Sphingobium sufflavum TaxID=1129547 RepID=UPI001F321B56|nr:amidohydrolase family protein [Sphingobium sufflavum]MCE7797292.1 amidohydrolase [Sphingobium sufflavum]
MMRFPRTFAALSAPLLTLALACALPTTAGASGLIDNVNGITTGLDGRIIRFGGLLVDKDGKVERRLLQGEKLPKKQPLDFRLDGKGMTLIPGFVDARADVMRLAISLLSLDLSDATSPDDAAARVATYAAEGRRWILGFGWDAVRWPAGSTPTAARLDRTVADTPVWLVDASGEQGWANSAALKLAGITAATPQPAGGHIVMAGGKPSGLLTGSAMELIEKIVPRPAPKDLDAAFLKAQAAYLARGITAVGDMGTSMTDWQTWRRAGDRDSLRLRIIGYASAIDDLPLIAGPQPTPWLYAGRLRLAGISLPIDGSLGVRRAWLSAPYADAPGVSGDMLLGDTRLRNQMSRAAMDGFQIVLAAHGDRATKEAADAIAEMGGSYLSRGRWRIDGADLAAAADLTGLPADRLSLTVSPASIADGGALARERLGARADGRAYGWKDIVGRQVGLAFAGQGPFTPLSPLEAIRLAITRETVAGQPFGGWRGDQRLSFAEAFRAVTAGGADALGAEGRFGRLAPGESADFLLLDRDIELAQPADIPRIKLLETWIGGQKILLDTKR